jgi:hypothetical protein
LFDGNGNPKRVPAFSVDFQETKLFYPKSQVIPRGTAAAQMLSGSNQSQQATKRFPDASTWFPDAPDWRAEKFSVVEISIKIGRYGILTFLEIHELEN